MTAIGTRFSSLGIVITGLILTTISPGYGQSIESVWDQHDPLNTKTIDHSEWQEILDSYLVIDDLSGIHLFDYDALQINTDHRGLLDGYVENLQELDPRKFARDVQMAYWINLYNSLTVKTVVEAYPVESIMEIHERETLDSGPWKDVRAKVAGTGLTLDNIEHDILRPIWQDNRIHYAVNCASLGCPSLRSQAFTAANLELLLEESAKDFVNHARAVKIVDSTQVITSSLYFWYIEDFGDSESGILAHLEKYAHPELAEELRSFNGSFDHEYDWRLNKSIKQ